MLDAFFALHSASLYATDVYNYKEKRKIECIEYPEENLKVDIGDE